MFVILRNDVIWKGMNMVMKCQGEIGMGCVIRREINY